MNINVPADAANHFFVEPDALEEFWAFRFRPKVSPGDDLLFHINKKVVARATCSRIERPGESSCDTTGRFKNLWKVMWRVVDFIDLR